jgi:hypothetical protein
MSQNMSDVQKVRLFKRRVEKVDLSKTITRIERRDDQATERTFFISLSTFLNLRDFGRDILMDRLCRLYWIFPLIPHLIGMLCA